MPGILAQTTTGPASPGQALELQGAEAAVFLVVVGLGLLAVWFVPLLLDARRAAYRLRREVIGFLRQVAMPVLGRDGLTLAELKALLSSIGEPATGQRGLARALLAMIVISVVGVAALLSCSLPPPMPSTSARPR